MLAAGKSERNRQEMHFWRPTHVYMHTSPTEKATSNHSFNATSHNMGKKAKHIPLSPRSINICPRAHPSRFQQETNTLFSHVDQQVK